MQLSKRERFLLVLLFVILMIVIGTVYVVMPLLDSIQTQQLELSDLQLKEMQIRDVISQKDDVDAAIIKAYDKAKETADIFLDPASAWDVEKYVLDFLDENGVVCSSISVPSYATAQIDAYDASSDVIFYPIKSLVEYINELNGLSAEDNTDEVSVSGSSDMLLKTTVAIQCRSDLLSLTSLLEDLSREGHTVMITGLTMSPDESNLGALKWELPLTAELKLDFYSVEKIR